MMRLLQTTGLALCLAGCASPSYRSDVATIRNMNVWEARKTVNSLAPNIRVFAGKPGKFNAQGKVTSISAGRDHFLVNTRAGGGEMTFRCPAGSIEFNGTHIKLDADAPEWVFCDREDSGVTERRVTFILLLDKKDDAMPLVDALSVVSRWAKGDTTIQYESIESSGRFDLAVKQAASIPANAPLPEEARRHAVQAATAVEAKRFEVAIASYENALQYAPWWKDGYFNLSLLYAERRMYMDAIYTMRKYVRLSPADARSAQDKIYEWEAQAKF